MTTLTINDLSRNEEMDRDGMADVRGGANTNLSWWMWWEQTGFQKESKMIVVEVPGGVQ